MIQESQSEIVALAPSSGLIERAVIPLEQVEESAQVACPSLTFLLIFAGAAPCGYPR